MLANEHLLNLCVFSGAGISYDVTKRDDFLQLIDYKE